MGPLVARSPVTTYQGSLLLGSSERQGIVTKRDVVGGVKRVLSLLFQNLPKGLPTSPASQVT
jgi:hypothetical protein